MRSSNGRDTYSLVTEKLKLKIEKGVPPVKFYADAWTDEPLTSIALPETDIKFALPSGDPERTYVVKDDAGEVVGHSAMNDTVTYWNHVNGLDLSQQNQSTRTFVEIHRLAVAVEQKHLNELDLDVNDSVHNAGVAVKPSHRRQGIAKQLTQHRAQQAEADRKTTNYSGTTGLLANAMRGLGFFKVDSFAYKELAVSLSNPALEKLDGSFDVWCKKLGK